VFRDFPQSCHIILLQGVLTEVIHVAGMQGRPLYCGEPRGLPLDEVTLPQRLKDLGYITRLVGKWHLGCQRSEYTPTRRGFDSHFGYWNGYVDYFDYMINQDVSINYRSVRIKLLDIYFIG
jgi:arylsulfatase A-like enzyme